VKPKMVRFIAASVIALSPLCTAEASPVEDLMAYNSGQAQTYSYTVTSPGRPPYHVTVQHVGAAARAARPASPQAPVFLQQSVAPRPAYQPSAHHARTNPAWRPSSRASSRKQTNRIVATNGVPSVKARSAYPRSHAPAARPHRPKYHAQSYRVPQRHYTQVPQAGYYRSPYQAQYNAARNYFQGYWYNMWGSSPQACMPGRA
jgi:hypothetical protein